MAILSAREYVRQWAETGRLLGQIRWRELRALSPAAALAASDALIDAALRIPCSPERLRWSGLVDQQAILHRRIDE